MARFLQQFEQKYSSATSRSFIGVLGHKFRVTIKQGQVRQFSLSSTASYTFSLPSLRNSPRIDAMKLRNVPAESPDAEELREKLFRKLTYRSMKQVAEATYQRTYARSPARL